MLCIVYIQGFYHELIDTSSLKLVFSPDKKKMFYDATVGGARYKNIYTQKNVYHNDKFKKIGMVYQIIASPWENNEKHFLSIFFQIIIHDLYASASITKIF